MGIIVFTCSKSSIIVQLSLGNEKVINLCSPFSSDTNIFEVRISSDPPTVWLIPFWVGTGLSTFSVPKKIKIHIEQEARHIHIKVGELHPVECLRHICALYTLDQNFFFTFSFSNTLCCLLPFDTHVSRPSNLAGIIYIRDMLQPYMVPYAPFIRENFVLLCDKAHRHKANCFL